MKKTLTKDELFSAFRTYQETENCKPLLLQQSYIDMHRYKTSATPKQILNILKFARAYKGDFREPTEFWQKIIEKEMPEVYR